MEKVNVIGMGYIGLPTALSLAVNGNNVVGTDCKREVIESLIEGKVEFAEAGINSLYQNAVRCGIQFTTQYQVADVYIIAVPTPYDRNTKKVDPSNVVNAVCSVLKVCPENAIIVIESTIPPGTIDKYVRPIINKPVHLVHAPERIIPGRIIEELKTNARTIGADIEVTDIRTAEMTKVVENTYRDINIAFANELSKICRSADLDVYEIIKIANMHPRVNILAPGPGVGGHCISVDPWFLVGDYPGLANIILAARKINDSMPEFVLERTNEIMRENRIKDVGRIGFYGLTYKEDVDDVRESPTMQLVESMKKHLSSNAKFYDPYVKRRIVDNQFFDFKDFLDSIDLIVIMVGHLQIKKSAEMLNGKIVFDTRNVIDGPDIYHL